MRTEKRKIAPGWLLAGACVLCTSWGPANAAKPEQSIPRTAPKETVGSRPSTKPVVLARNTNAKTASAGTTTTTKPLTPEEKKAVSRCWKRLMGMVREVNHAHRTKK